MAKRHQKKPEFPEENRICGIIFLCQLIAVLSAVSIVYLTVVFYAPSIRAIASTFEHDSVMCTTVLADDSKENCTWLSCFEWCLTKWSGLCMQIWVSVRNNGSNLRFDECRTEETSCATNDFIPTHRHICQKNQCEFLGGLFNCTKGTCVNVTSALTCNKFTSIDKQVSCKRRENCQTLDGFYTCADGFCMRVFEPYTCEHRCTHMTTHTKNTVIFNGDRIIMAKCLKVVDLSTEESVWDPSTSPNETLFISCTQVSNSSNSLIGHDCLNASLVQPSALRNDSSLAQLMDSYYHPSSRRLPKLNDLQVPNESELLIYNRSKLLVNLEFCVNSLRDECREFFAIHGRDGRDLRAQARFPCYYSLDKNDTVLTKFNRPKAIVEFALTSIIPAFLLIFSCTCLVLCTRIVGVGPDAHMRIMGFRKKTDQSLEGVTAETELLPNNDTNRNGKSSRNVDSLINNKTIST